VEKKKVIIIILLLSAIVLIQALIIIKPFGRREVTTPEEAVLLAKAELVRRYGMEEISGKEFRAIISGRYWRITQDLGQNQFQLGYPPQVYVRVSDGRAISLWRDGVRHRVDIFIDSWLR